MASRTPAPSHEHGVADLLLLAAPEQDAVRHDDCPAPAALQRGQHMLDEHQVSLLARLRRHPVNEPLPVLALGSLVVLGERRIGDHAVELLQAPALHV